MKGEKCCLCSQIVRNVRNLRLECAKMVRKGLLVHVLIYLGEAVVWREKERFRVKTFQVDNEFGGCKNR